MPVKLGDPEEGQPPIDFEPIATKFGDKLEQFEGALDRLTEARKLRDEAFVAKKEAEDRLRSVYANIARVQEGYFRLSGLDELAERIRLTISNSKPSKKKTEESGLTRCRRRTRCQRRTLDRLNLLTLQPHEGR